MLRTEKERGVTMRVAFVSFDFGEYCIRLAAAMVAQDAKVLLLLPAEQQPAGMTVPAGIDFHAFHKPRLRQALLQLFTVTELVRRIKAFKPDVVHVQQGHLWFNLALPFLMRYPLVMTAHDVMPHPGDQGARNTPQMITDFGFRRADRLIVHGQAIKQLLIASQDIRSEIVHVIPHIALGHDQTARKTAERDGQILFFGRIWGYKGLEYLIRAEPLITAEVPSAKIVIAGQGENFERYRRLIKNPEQFLVLNQYISPEQQTELFRQASLVVLPYVEASQSGVIPVAYTFAKPVVATTVGALPEMVDDGRTGYLVPPRDPEALAVAIVRLLKDRHLRRRVGQNGKRKIDSECSPEVVSRQTLAVYRAAVAARAHAKGDATWAWGGEQR
jgi:glycosyltransferase involved in cell wall biosynthesis